MTEKLIKNIIIYLVAPILLALGLLVGFLDLKKIGLKEMNDGYVTAIFSLTAVFLYFAAIMYQIKEYKLQIIELRKSVKAQTISSKALEEQKQILLEQSFTNLIFKLMSDFKSFKTERDIHRVFAEIKKHFKGNFAVLWREIAKEKRLNKTELNEKFAQEIINHFSVEILKQNEIELFKQYLQFCFNILSIIDENKKNLTTDYYTSTFFVQLSKEEILLIALADLVEFGLPPYQKIDWKHQYTEILTKWIEESNEQFIDLTELDKHILTNKFTEIKKARA
ncbi:MAG: hypothetical protein U5L09_06540 [Bacteroidales bacterium]|nr:hypothetical protein [Bacteroidales bacterium]